MRILVLTALLLPAAVWAQDAPIPGGELSLAGVAVGDPPGRVRALLGEPHRVIDDPARLALRYEYPELTVSFSENEVSALHATGPRACTPRRLCPGDPLDRMRTLYGEPRIADRAGGRVYEYYGSEVYCWLRIAAAGDTVASIAVDCQP
ncbi:hypothetical protein [Vulcaniibacterium thermophilum]|uniref:Uncharacterized protein n=1 Tax=Vulcaniibacterium thermophilum TaxID=1169913 RepID=A0A918YYU1_9GAMM|nr:hypothetical protein [Vulcaniibacterium thermophilum]GHE28986.1 hypothetical protein GCM10007167_08390 [Vulcaniibacterium thermophilum]